MVYLSENDRFLLSRIHLTYLGNMAIVTLYSYIRLFLESILVALPIRVRSIRASTTKVCDWYLSVYTSLASLHVNRRN